MAPLVSPATPASAGSTYQFNVLGNHNTKPYGNYGGLSSVTWMVDVIKFMNGMDPTNIGYPWAVSTQEICDSTGVAPNSQQYDYVAAELAAVTSNGYTEGFWQAKTVGGACNRKGNAIYARANSRTSVWSADAGYAFTQKSGDDDFRGMVCVHPTLFVLSWVACSAHLTTGSGAPAQAQATDAASIFMSYAWTTYSSHTILGGDFNLNASDMLGWYYGWPFQWTDEVDAVYPTLISFPQLTCCMPTIAFGGSMDSKIDYTWFARFSRQAGATVIDPPYDPPFALPKSDHRLLFGRIS